MQGKRGSDGRSGHPGPRGKKVTDHGFSNEISVKLNGVMSYPVFARSIGSYWTEGLCWRAGSTGNLPEFEELGPIPLYRPN